MSDLKAIESALQKTARRQRWQRGWRGFWQGFLAGAVVWLLALVIFKLTPVPIAILPAVALIALVFMVVGFVVGWTRPLSLAETARWVDQKQNLQERMSTALEVASARVDDTWKQLIAQDAAKCVPQIDPKRLLPFHLPRAARWSMLVLMLAAGLGFVPE